MGRHRSDRRSSRRAVRRQSDELVTAAFFATSVLNFLMYTTCLSAAADLLPGQTGAVLVSLQLPMLLVKVIEPWVDARVLPYGVRACFVGLVGSIAPIVTGIGLGMNRRDVKIAGMCLTSIATGVGEVTFQALIDSFRSVDRSGLTSPNSQLLVIWTTGWGCAGILGSVAYALLTSFLAWRPMAVYFAMTPLPALIIGVYFCVLAPASARHVAEERARREDKVRLSADDEALLIARGEGGASLALPLQRGGGAATIVLSSDGRGETRAACGDKAAHFCRLLRFLLPLFWVYFAEFGINQGLDEPVVNSLPNPRMPPLAQYRLYQMVYQIAQVVGRLSALRCCRCCSCAGRRDVALARIHALAIEWNAETLREGAAAVKGIAGAARGAAANATNAASSSESCRRQVLVDYVRHVVQVPSSLRAAQPTATKAELRRQLDVCTRLAVGSGRRSVVPGMVKGSLVEVLDLNQIRGHTRIGVAHFTDLANSTFKSQLPAAVLWLMALLESGVFASLVMQVFVRWMRFSWLIFIVAAAEGWIGGFTLANALIRVADYSDEAEKAAKGKKAGLTEFSLGIAAVADSAGIVLAGICALAYEPHLCRHVTGSRTCRAPTVVQTMGRQLQLQQRPIVVRAVHGIAKRAS